MNRVEKMCLRSALEKKRGDWTVLFDLVPFSGSELPMRAPSGDKHDEIYNLAKE